MNWKSLVSKDKLCILHLKVLSRREHNRDNTGLFSSKPSDYVIIFSVPVYISHRKPNAHCQLNSLTFSSWSSYCTIRPCFLQQHEIGACILATSAEWPSCVGKGCVLCLSDSVRALIWCIDSETGALIQIHTNFFSAVSTDPSLTCSPTS